MANYALVMKMKNGISFLFQKFVNKTISKEELEKFNTYLKKSDHGPQIRQHLSELWDYFELAEKYKSINFPKESSKDLDKKNRRLEELIKASKGYDYEIERAIKKIGRAESDLNYKRKKTGFWNWLKRFFIISVVAGGAGMWYYLSHEGIVVSPEVAYVEKVSQHGQKSTIPLSDGSQVKLNSGSKLIFPKLFEGNTREVFLEGEAFFEVEKDPGSPFIVRSGDLVTTVLGTSFNIKAYPGEEAIEVTVATGKVKVQKDAAKDQDNIMANQELELTPNQQAVYSLTGDDLTKLEVDAEKYLDWSNGTLHFEETRFEEVIVTLSRWYDVDFELMHEGLNDCLIIGEYNNASLYTVLESLKVVLGIEYQFTADRVKIDGKGCDG